MTLDEISDSTFCVRIAMSMLKAGLRLVGIAMLSCPMIGLEPIGQTSEGCHTVHRLTLIIIIIIIIYGLYSNRINCVHPHNYSRVFLPTFRCIIYLHCQHGSLERACSML